MPANLGRFAALCLACLLASSVAVHDARALPVYADDDTTVGAILFLRGGIDLNSEAGEIQDPALRVNFARLGLSVERDGLGDALLIVEGSSGNVELLDLLMRLTPTEQIELGVGRYRPNFGLEWYYPRFAIPFRSRSATSALALNRMLGTHVAATSRADNLIHGSRVDVALYSPSFSARSSSATDSETFVTVRLQLRLAGRVLLHGAVAERATGAGARASVVQQTRLSAGAQYQRDRVVALVEFMSASLRSEFSNAEIDDVRALSLFAAYRAPVGQRELMPVFGLDVTNDPLRGEDITNVRSRLGLQYSLLGDNVATGVTWDWTNPGGSTELVALNYYLQFLL